jgi:hypothetical protein
VVRDRAAVPRRAVAAADQQEEAGNLFSTLT